MAFQQPARQSMQQRVSRPEVDGRDVLGARPTQESLDRQPEESQTWVLFSPATEITTTSYLSETEQSIQTQPRSRLDDAARLNAAERDAESRQSSLFSAILDEAVDEDAELDSLDSHLPEFRSLPGIYAYSQPGNQQAQPILPTHDGLGSFRLDQPALGADAQDRIYQFERFNPRRVQQQQRESLDHARLELEYEQDQVAEKRQRIEAWRLEHSRVLLEEVQRETRRRRQSHTQPGRLQVSDTVLKSRVPERDAELSELPWHDEDPAQRSSDEGGFIARYTRKILKEVLDIDDRLLEILVGDALPDEDELSTTPRASQPLAQTPATSTEEQSWQIQMLERVSRELGLLVNQLSQHPGAFSTYTRVQQMPIPYAGLPIIPESGSVPAIEEPLTRNETQASVPEFRPTMEHTSPISIPGRRAEPAEAGEEAGWGSTFSKEEWEQDLDIKLVFRYLRSRFTSRWASTPTSSTAHVATNSTQDMAAKAARIRQHHPLTSRVRPTERRTFKATTPSSPVAMRHHSSCASQSTRRSARRSSSSSRHFWDIGGSIGTGSVVAPTGPMGSWGEV